MARLILSLLAMIAFASTAPAFAGDIQKGRETYELHCSVCHGIDGMPIDMTIPSFANGDRLFQMDQDLLRSIREGRELMPAFRGMLSDEEIRDVIAFLRTL
jgi:cytochrome c6